MKIVSLIPLRWWSKSIPYKNIKMIWWKPLCSRTIEASLWSKYINETRISTDDKKIKDIVGKTWAKIIDRPEEYANDTASTESVMLHFMQNTDFDIVVTIQATSPLTTSEDIDKAIELFLKNKYDSLVTWVKTKRFFWNINWEALNYEYKKRPRRQDFEWTIMENWAFYITKREILQSHKNRLGGNIWIYEMDESTAVEIDEPNDRSIVENLLLKKHNISKHIKKIKVIFSDFDWVWTDNKVYLDANWNENLLFSKEDSLGLNLFREKTNIPIIIVSKERNDIVKKRCEKLQLRLEKNMDNKLMFIEEYIKKNKITWQNVCYIGNDVNDLDCMKKAWVSFCPNDGNKDVQEISTYILKSAWWNGAIREMLDLISNNI